MNFTIDIRLADAPGDQLGILRAEIEDKDFLMHGGDQVAVMGQF